MRAALVGLPQSGKSTLFAALAEAGGSHVHLDRPDQQHLAVVKVPDERLDWLEEHYKPKKKTHAEIEFLDVPGLDLSSDAGRRHARTHWPAIRQSDMIVIVLRDFRDDTVPPYRNRIDPAADLEELRAEMLFSDLEQATGRVEKLWASVGKPTPEQDRNIHELELMQRFVEALESEKPLTEVISDKAEEKMARAFAFQTLKPVLVVLNSDEDAAVDAEADRFGGYAAIRLSAKIEEEIASLAPADRGEFMEAMGISTLAHDRLVRSCYKAMNLITFLTAGEKECRAWSIPAGADALTAAGQIHSDIARGFIRAQVIAFDDLKAAGSEKAARAAGKFRLEGKNYIVRDGDEILFRFNV
ncbi:MAG: DUF933 domain-containing protein [Planctomycetota bacterium]|nr:DUF933 domain-containing protein [Planctomycetota bacterium]